MSANVTLQVYSDRLAANPMRNILGICNTPRITTLARKKFDTEKFAALNFKYIRFHDAPLENPGQQLIDIHRIFPLFHADETDPRNYFFGQTDDYLAAIPENDAEIDFRLGETIDHSLNARLIGAPADMEKWARICRNIIGHYKNGEMNGFRYNITRVTVWEEPDNSRLFGGTVEQYAEMFCTIYRRLKEDFPDLKIGGPTLMMDQWEFLTSFLTVCQKNGITPDYITATAYTRTPDQLLDYEKRFREHLIALGLPEVPFHFAEWHLGPLDWINPYAPQHGLRTTRCASFAVSSLIRMMDAKYLEIAYFYAWATGAWGVIDPYNPILTVLPVYYGLDFFQKIAAACSERLAVTCDADESLVNALAGRTPDGKLRLLISCYDCEPCRICCTVPGVNEGKLFAIREDYEEAQCLHPTPIRAENGSFCLEHTGTQGVYLLEF